jgi:hypothetical protein
MADYYPLIARAALTRQLASIDPPPAGEIIDREIAALETVIRRIETENAARRPPEPPATPSAQGAEPVAEPPSPVGEETRPGPARPAAPVRPASGPNRKPLYAVAGAIGMVVVVAIATLAFLRRNEPPAMANQRPTATTASPQPSIAPPQPPKQDERIATAPQDAGTRPAPAPTPPRPAPTQPQPQAQPAAPPVSQPIQPAIAIANRLVMAMEGTDRPENVVVRQGSVVWRTEMISGGQGQPPQLAIKALLDAPDARMRAEMTIQRNRDPAFPASHTIQVQFVPGQGSEFGAVRNLSQIELRQSENQPGYPLAGQGIAVVENVFLLALAQVEPAFSRNMEMIRSRPLLYLEFQNTTGRRGLMVIEKGVSGQQAFDEAFRNWQ